MEKEWRIKIIIKLKKVVVLPVLPKFIGMLVKNTKKAMANSQAKTVTIPRANS